MDTIDEVRDASRLRELAERYARTADAGDVDGFVSVFHPDAVLEVWRPERTDGPSGVRRGHGELAGVPPALRRYTRTDHRVLDVVTTMVDDDSATGAVTCEAHHVQVADDGAVEDLVMSVAYRDRYRRGADGVWRIAHRRVGIERIDVLPLTALPQEDS